MDKNNNDLLSQLEEDLPEELLAKIDKEAKQAAKEEVKEELAAKEEPVKKETPKKEEVKKEEDIIDDRHSQVNPVSGDKEITLDQINKGDLKEVDESINYPNATFDKYVEYFKKLDEIRRDNRGFEKNLNKRQTMDLYINMDTPSKTIMRNVYADHMNKEPESYVNSIVFGEKDLNTRPINFSTKGKVSPASIYARFNAFLGTGEVVQVPLWHSGFWVTIKPIKQKDFVNLSISINNEITKLGRSTSALIYSNYSVVFIRLVTDFIIKNMVATTITLKEDDDIRKYIKAQDIYPLINGLLAAMYPKGLHITRICNKSLEVTDDGTPKCDYSVTATVDPKKLLWVNRKALTPKQLAHMANKQESSVSTDEVLEYQAKIKDISSKTFDIKVDDEKSFSVTLETPNLLDFVSNGEMWIEDIIKSTESLFLESDGANAKEEKLSDMLASAKLNVYNNYVKSIVSSDGLIRANNAEDVNKLLEVIGSDNELYAEVLKEIIKYTDEAVIAIVATPNYKCPKCEEVQGDEKGVFKEFIPLNLLENFFDLGDLRLRKIRQTDI